MISRRTSTCPGCGTAPPEPSSRAAWLLAILLVLAAAFGAAGQLGAGKQANAAGIPTSVQN
jgi:hypothetical protein